MARPKNSKVAKFRSAEIERTGTVQALSRGLSVLEALALSSARGSGVTDVASHTGLSISTCHRLLTTLSRDGYVTKEKNGHRYFLGHRILGIASSIECRTSHLRMMAQEYLDRISAETGETVALAILDQRRTVYVGIAEGVRALRFMGAVGMTFPAHTSASAKAIMAYDKDDERISYLFADTQLVRRTKRTLMTATSFKEHLRKALATGYAIEYEELEEGLSAIAAVIRDKSGKAVAAISMPGPTSRIIGRNPDLVGRMLQSYANQASRQLGFTAKLEVRSC
jgi:IclR family acetate operon transcriptional repressor